MGIKKKKPEVLEKLSSQTPKDRVRFLTGYFKETRPVATRILKNSAALGGAVACADTIVKRIDVIRGKGSIMDSVIQSLFVNENSHYAEEMDLRLDRDIDASVDRFAQYFPVETTEDIWQKWLKHKLWDEVISCMMLPAEKEDVWYAVSVCSIVECFIECRDRYRKWWENK